MQTRFPVLYAIRQELYDWRLWAGRAVVLAFAALAGLVVVGFTWLTEQAFAQFVWFKSSFWWGPLFWTPVSTVGIVWLMRRYAPGSTGSGIPQVIATLKPEVGTDQRSLFVSIRLSIAKILLSSWGFLAGLSLGREGPSVQIAAGVMRHARRWLPAQSKVSAQGLMLAGGAAGIAAAFNTPLAGVMFAIEELEGDTEHRSNGLLLAAIILGGMMAVSVHGNATYFGVIRVEKFSEALLMPALFVAISSGLFGGLFSRLVIVSLAGRSDDWFTRFRLSSPLRFAAACGLAVAVLGLISHGDTYGSGYAHARATLEGNANEASVYVVLKFIATWVTTWSGVPAGIFAPALAIGGALGNDIVQLAAYANAPTLIALGMAGFLAAVTQAPMTAFIIVMEMVDGHALVLSLMASALVASGVSRLISAPLYPSLARLQLQRLPPREDQKKSPEGP